MTEFQLRSDIGALLRQRRTAAKLSQADVGRWSGVSQSEISKLERGENSTNVDLVERLFGSLGLRVRVSLETLDAEVDSEIERLLVQSTQQRLTPWIPLLQRLQSIDAVIEGSLAALLQAVPVPVDIVDIAVTKDTLDALARFLARHGAWRWSDHRQEYWPTNSDPRKDGALRWQLLAGELQARICRQRPDALTVHHEEFTCQVRPLHQLTLTDPVQAAVVRRYLELGSTAIEADTAEGAG